MSAANESNGTSGGPPEGEGVLAKLPRTRPQRSSARRAAARGAAGANGAVKVQKAPSADRAASSRARTGARSATTAGRPPKPRTAKSPAEGAARRPGATEPGREAVPRQGFECEGESSSSAVQPPGGTELLTSAVEIVGEVAKAGLSTGERLLKDLLSRLPLS
jgi:hypothetical protein